MIYTVCQLVEKSWEHRSKVFLLFIDLKKAYDSVPREAIWTALGKLGVPEPVIDLIQSFHQNMQAQIQLNGTLLEEIDVTNGLQQLRLLHGTCPFQPVCLPGCRMLGRYSCRDGRCGYLSEIQA